MRFAALLRLALVQRGCGFTRKISLGLARDRHPICPSILAASGLASVEKPA